MVPDMWGKMHIPIAWFMYLWRYVNKGVNKNYGDSKLESSYLSMAEQQHMEEKEAFLEISTSNIKFIIKEIA